MARTKALTPTLYAISVGPGEPKLMTMQAIECLQQTPVVAWLQNPDRHSRAYNAAKPYIQPQQEQRPYTIEMRASTQDKNTTYDAIAANLKQDLDSGKSVAFLVLGDVTLYASFHALALRLQHYPIVMLPGISAVSASAAHLGIALAQKTDNLHILTPPITHEQLNTIVTQQDTAIIMKPARNLSAIKTLVRDYPTVHGVLIDNITLPNQRILPLDSYDEPVAPYFSIILLSPRAPTS